MEYEQIKKIMKDMEESSLTELSLEFPDGTKINLKNKGNGVVDSKNSEEIGQQNVTPRVYEKDTLTAYKKDTPPAKKQEQDENIKIVKSPMVGTFYEKPSPDAESYVKVGQKVKKGDILCIIEAMKLMNEIESEFDGEIVDILVKDQEMVDYGKPLFKIK